MPVVRSKITSKAIQDSRPKKIMRTLGLKEYCDKRNKILILRGCGGLGDIFMHRMMFEDFKRLMPDLELHFACPKYYHDAVRDHPYVDVLLDVNDVNKDNYIVHYNTTTACGRAEMKLAPFAGPHRSDIWASHCGVLLTKHDMHIKLTEEEKAIGKEKIESHRDRQGPTVIITPISAMHTKNLFEHHVIGLVNGLRDRGMCPIGLHDQPMWTFLKNDFPAIGERKMRNWMSILNQADYIVSVDTAAFHCAGGMKKPLVGIFTFASSAAYGKYYSTAELLQGPCPFGYSGCYNWGACPKSKEVANIPCHSGITTEMILGAVDKMVAKWPVTNST
jgi:ADP-heptose:LPS heptosyltransferase